MTRSREQSQRLLPVAADPTTAPGSRPGRQPADEQAERADIETVKNELRARVDHLAKDLGEDEIGGSRYPAAEDDGVHTTARLEWIVGGFQVTDKLWACSPVQQIQLLIDLWQRCWDLWYVSLAYRTLEAVERATAEFVERATAPGTDRPNEGWEHDALRAVGHAMRLITADMDVFKQINLSSADGLKRAAHGSIETMELTMEEVRSPLAALGSRSGKPDDDSRRIVEGLREIENLACKNQIFYAALADAAGALIEFESWLAAAPRLGSALPRGSSGSRPSRGELLASVDAAIESTRRAHASLRELTTYASLREFIAQDSLTKRLSPESLEDLGELISQDSLRNLSEVIAQRSLGELIAQDRLGELIAHASVGKLVAQDVADDQILSCFEPWERLLTDVRAIVVAGTGAAGAAGRVLVPRRVSIRYCYPFAVDAKEQARHPLDRRQKEDLEKLLEQLKRELNKAFGAISIKVGELGSLMPTEFFAKGPGLYGGVRVGLPEIEFRFEPPPGVDGDERGGRCKVWVVLSHLGNHCLCIEPESFDVPPPHLLYRALHIGTPVAVGARVFLTAPPGGTPVGWDNLHSFSRDVIQAIASIPFWGTDGHLPAAERFERGNLHEIVVVRTDDPLGIYPEEIAVVLDRVAGGRILVRSVQRTATTLEEWVRYPPVPRNESRGPGPAIVGIPEMGLAGDWCISTGETTVFGIVAAPSWHSDVYVEAAQFASSLSPQLRLWNRHIGSTIRSLEPDSDGEEGGEEEAELLRRIESQVRLRVEQIKTEELTATLAHRRFLDQLLEMAALSRLQGELEAQLQAAERLTDWFSEHAQQESDRRRQVLLAAIALFGLFEVGTLLSIANTTGFPKLFFITVRKGVWEDWLMLVLFLLAVLAVIYLFNKRVGKWMKRRARELKSGRQARETGRLYGHEYHDTVPRPTGRRGCGPHRDCLS
jgi:hypothetical protein